MRIVAYVAYPIAAVLFAQTHPSLALVALILMGWLVMLTSCERRLVPNDGPWNEAEALSLSFTVLPTMTIGLVLFAPLYACWALTLF